MSKPYTLVLNFGYAESQRMSFMPWTSKQKFANARDAVIDLAAFLKEMYLSNRDVELGDCCRAVRINQPNVKFCPKCGCNVQDPEFDIDLFSDWLCQLDSDIDGFNSALDWEQWEEGRWQAGSLEGAKNLRFIYNAEKVLAAVVDDEDYKKFAEICKNRTKSKRDSFTYY